LALVNGFKGAGFISPYLIFNNIEAGIVGARNRAVNETATIYNSKNIDKMALENPRGTVVMSHNFMDNPENRQNQLLVIEAMTGEMLTTKTMMDNLRKKGYTEGQPALESLTIFTDPDGTNRQGGPEGTVVPPLNTLEGMIFELNRLTILNNTLVKQMDLFRVNDRISTLPTEGEAIIEGSRIVKNTFKPAEAIGAQPIDTALVAVIGKVIDAHYQQIDDTLDDVKIDKMNASANGFMQTAINDFIRKNPDREIAGINRWLSKKIFSGIC